MRIYLLHFKSLPNEKTLDWSEFKAFADDKINITSEHKFFLEWVETLQEKEKMLVPAFSPFPTFSKGFFPRVVKSQDCMVKINEENQF